MKNIDNLQSCICCFKGQSSGFVANTQKACTAGKHSSLSYDMKGNWSLAGGFDVHQGSLRDAKQVLLGNSELALRPEKNFLLFSVFPAFPRIALRMLRSQTALTEGRTSRWIPVWGRKSDNKVLFKLLFCIIIFFILQKQIYDSNNGLVF